ncbi:MAG: c-type cytochrome [Acidobacteria bacterium]|nr:c-type cytochrome [Acidobacteriota bacterium]
MKRTSVAFVTGWFWLLVWCGRASPQATLVPGNPIDGRKVFAAKGCVSCHSVWGSGGTLGPDLAKAASGKSLLQLAGLLWSHSPRMIEVMKQRDIPRPTFQPEEMANLIAYLYYLNYFDEPGNALEGERLFFLKGCVRCHSLSGKGGAVGPALDKYAGQMSPISLAQAMWNHGPRMTAKRLEKWIAMPLFAGREMGDLMAYIRSATPDRGRPSYMAPGNPQEGEKLFRQKGCIKCHSVRGAGGKVGPDLGRGAIYRSVTEMAGNLWNHGPRMWDRMMALGLPFIEFSGTEMADIIAYLYFVRYFDEPGDVRKGNFLFTQKGCSQCHAGAQAQRVGPDLATSEAIDSPIHLAAAMWNHAPVMEQRLREKGLPWPKFEGNEMRDLIAYIQSLKPRAALLNRSRTERAVERQMEAR